VRSRALRGMSGSLSTSGAADAPAQLYNMVKSSTVLVMLIAISLFFFFDPGSHKSKMLYLSLIVAVTTEVFESVAARSALAAQAAAQAAAQVAVHATERTSSWARSVSFWLVTNSSFSNVLLIINFVGLCILVYHIVCKDKMGETQLASAPAAAARAATVHAFAVPAAAGASAVHTAAVGTGAVHDAVEGDVDWTMCLKSEVQRERRRLDLTQTALARAVGTSQPQISVWLNQPGENWLAWRILAWLELNNGDAASRVRSTIPTQ
jgi:hypothetical protein